MITKSINLLNLNVPCYCHCRYCLLEWKGKTIGIDYERSVNYAKSFYKWLKENIPEIFEDFNKTEQILMENLILLHDNSKFKDSEYIAYDKYFYGGNKSYEVIQNFNKAWLTHIHNNPHHWQHWILINDDPDKGEIILDMPDIYIIEMICDWWSFSWKKGDLREIFNWYAARRDYMKLSDNTRKNVEYILDKMHKKLNESDVNGD